MLIGILAGVAGLVVGCCGGIGIGSSLKDKPAEKATASTAEATTEAPAVVAEPPAPTPTATTPPTPPSTTAAASAVMPDVVGQNAAVAEDELRRLGFTKIQLGSQDEHDTVVILAANWTVTKQSTGAGERVPLDTLIVLTCTKKR
ncbi:PASTA domain-containing protein [Rhizomonospora bruguierae]|uniref:PASTA domain-containing protein n=1 Tax=Rhizomonospora bruguierae TaxID=1581705 RepID=UPI001BD17416|nr:PASTA domain-containing protein [Micromonospora sp. NBRC 107566]